MLGFMKKVFGIGQQTDSAAAIPEQARTEEFYTKLAAYAQPRIGDDPTLEMLGGLDGTCVLFRTPESLGLPSRGRTWEALVDSDTGAFNRIAVFLDVAPIDQVVRDFFHDALPVIERSRRGA